VVRPEDINFMARFGARPDLPHADARSLHSSCACRRWCSDNDRERRTNFTVSIEAAEGVTTGISAYDRAHTMRTAVAPNARPITCASPDTSSR
jgi:3,4-dihydroxy 2-butanone 4-phosphate synthase/GTP cyclohydrolase II